jgi:hypothetical protein
VERHLGALAVNLGGGGEQHLLLVFVGEFEHVFRAADVCLQGQQRVVYNILHTHGGSQVIDHVAVFHQAFQQLVVQHRVDGVAEPLVMDHVSDVGKAAGGKVVQNGYFVPLLQQVVGQMRADETGAAGNEYLHLFLQNRAGQPAGPNVILTGRAPPGCWNTLPLWGRLFMAPPGDSRSSHFYVKLFLSTLLRKEKPIADCS